VKVLVQTTTAVVVVSHGTWNCPFTESSLGCTWNPIPLIDCLENVLFTCPTWN